MATRAIHHDPAGPIRVTSYRLLVLLAIGVASIACRRGEAERSVTAARNDGDVRAVEVDGACVVAQGRGFTITVADIEALRASYVPALERGVATRLATDVWLAEWIATGAIGAASLRERIAYQQQLSAREGAAAWGVKLSEASAALEVRHGPCYTARPRV